MKLTTRHWRLRKHLNEVNFNFRTTFVTKTTFFTPSLRLWMTKLKSWIVYLHIYSLCVSNILPPRSLRYRHANYCSKYHQVKILLIEGSMKNCRPAWYPVWFPTRRRLINLPGLTWDPLACYYWTPEGKVLWIQCCQSVSQWRDSRKSSPRNFLKFGMKVGDY